MILSDERMLGEYREMPKFQTISLLHENRKLLMSVFLALFLSPGLLAPDSRDDQAQSEKRYREERETWMRSEKSPLALAGLFWLKSGTNTFGTDPSNDIVLPAGTGPARVGRFHMVNNRVQIQVEDPKAAISRVVASVLRPHGQLQLTNSDAREHA